MRSPRTLLAISATLALTAAALVPTAAFARGPGAGAAGCDGDCDATQAQSQPIRARDGSGQQVETRASAGGGGQVRARAESGSSQDVDRPRNRAAGSGQGIQAAGNGQGGQTARNGGNGQGNEAMGNAGAGRGWDEDALRGPEYCDECEAEMGILSEADIDGLRFMANEEKMAHDIYAEFASMYDLPVFERIAQSEARHQLAVDTVLERYGIEDATSSMDAGRFSDTGIQQRYDELLAKGSASLEDALAVGVLIEETDIADLEVRVAGFDDIDTLADTAPDVFEMYSNLLKASGNHLNAFQRQQ